MSSVLAGKNTGVRIDPVQDDSLSFRILFAASFTVFLVIALCAQLVFGKWRSWLPGAEGDGSLISGVKASVYTFMSWLT